MSIARILAAALAVAVILPIGAQASTLTEQALCDAKAEQAYKKLLLVQQLSKDSSGYTSHYDEKNQLCFMGVETHTTAGLTIRFVLDAIGGQTYASYTWGSQPRKKYWEVAPMECHVTTLAGERLDCNNDDEFDSLTRKNFGLFFK
jgi:hypothetical protein